MVKVNEDEVPLALEQAIERVMAAHFRTDSDTGAAEQAMLVMNAFRSCAGLEPMKISDLPRYCTTCFTYHKIGEHLRALENVLANVGRRCKTEDFILKVYPLDGVMLTELEVQLVAGSLVVIHPAEE